MAGPVKFCFAFLLVFHASLVSCRPDYHQYFSQYIKDESTTTGSSLSSTTGISAGKSENISNPEAPYSENVISPKANSYSSSDNAVYEKPVQSAYSDYEDDSHTILKIRLLIIVGCIVAVGLILCCIAVCCPQRFKGRERRGFIINTNAPEQSTANLIQPQIPQAVAAQYIPPGFQSPQHPPPYGTRPIQYPASENLLQPDPKQPMDQQQNPIQPMSQQQPPLPYGYNNP